MCLPDYSNFNDEALQITKYISNHAFVEYCNTETENQQHKNNTINENSVKTDILIENSFGLACKGFRVGCLNIQGILTKLDEIKLLLIDDPINIIGFCVTLFRHIA